MPTIHFSISEIENPPEKFEKKKKKLNSKNSRNNIENCKTEQELNNILECTDEMDNDGSDWFGESEDVNEEGNPTCTDFVI